MEIRGNQSRIRLVQKARPLKIPDNATETSISPADSFIQMAGIMANTPKTTDSTLFQATIDHAGAQLNNNARPTAETLRKVTKDYGISELTVAPINNGLTNLTYLVSDQSKPRYILQRLHKAYPAQTNGDIRVVNEFLVQQGHTSSRLVPTVEGKFWQRDHHGDIWRLCTFVPGKTYSKTADPALCNSAGFALGRLHQTLNRLNHNFAPGRPILHDLDFHLRSLRKALADPVLRHHPAWTEANKLAEEIFKRAHGFADLNRLPQRISHGDPKLDNIIFGKRPCFIDLDSMQPMSTVFDLGDAFRSWCNPQGADAPNATFDIQFFEAALDGYLKAAPDLLTSKELESLGDATECITLELAARMCVDALHESQFAWDRSRYASAWRHNIERTKSKLALADSIHLQQNAIVVVIQTVSENLSG